MQIRTAVVLGLVFVTVATCAYHPGARDRDEPGDLLVRHTESPPCCCVGADGGAGAAADAGTSADAGADAYVGADGGAEMDAGLLADAGLVVTGRPHRLSAGKNHTCFINTSGALYCWGDNSNGQLGILGVNRALQPSAVLSLGGTAAAVAAGFVHTCALLTDGRVRCFGENAYAQLGDGTIASSAAPVDVFGMGAATAVTVGHDHTCALNAGGGVVCWGRNHAGQLGDGTATSRRTPTAVVGLASGIDAISAGREHTCALTMTGDLYCWGKGSHGRLGVGGQHDQRVPTRVFNVGAPVVAVSAGREHTCALTSVGGVRCWGSNSAGQLGDGTTTDRLFPVDADALSTGVVAISAGREHTCVVTSQGSVRCFGKGQNGRLGDGVRVDRPTAVDVFGLTAGSEGVAAGGFHTCTMLSTGALACWGGGSYGQLGSGLTRDELLPVTLTVP